MYESFYKSKTTRAFVPRCWITALEFRLFAIANECGLCKWLIGYLFIWFVFLLFLFVVHFFLEGEGVCMCVLFFWESSASLFVTLDLDECRGNNNHCHQNAVCINTLGSYKCQCAKGYTGDGFSCSGKEFFFPFFLLQGENAFMDCILTV